MIILKINPIKPDKKILKFISEEIKKGKLIAYPTDTLYGLCTNPFDNVAVKRLFEAKNRDISKGLPILINKISFLSKIAFFTKRDQGIMKKFWPGALTLILHKKEVIPDLVTGNRETVAVRIPKSIITNHLTSLCGGFIIGTSANKSGSKMTPKNASAVENEIGQNIDYILDGGETEFQEPSTIIDLTKKPLLIIREGKIKKKELMEFIN